MVLQTQGKRGGFILQGSLECVHFPVADSGLLRCLYAKTYNGPDLENVQLSRFAND